MELLILLPNLAGDVSYFSLQKPANAGVVIASEKEFSEGNG
jgi:hypothetical protein